MIGPVVPAPGSRLAIGAVFVVGAALLRFVQLGSQPLWFDEALSLHIAIADDGLDFIHNTAPLYHVLTRWWCALFGHDVAALRSLSAVVGAGFVGGTFVVADAVFGRATALAAGVITLLSPLHLYYSQEARAYGLLLLLLLLVHGALWRLARSPSRRAVVVLVLASSAALFTHYLAALPLLVAYVAIGCVRRDPARPAPWRRVLVAGAIAAVSLLPWLWWWRRTTAFDPADMQWLQALWQELTVPAALGWSCSLFLLGGHEGHSPVFLKQLSSLGFPVFWWWLAVLAAGGLGLLAALTWRQRPRAQRLAVAQAAALAVLPLVLLVLVSFVKPMYCPGRYDLIALPGFVLLLAHAVAAGMRAPRRVVRTVASVLVSLLGAAVLVKDTLYFTAPAGDEPSRRITDHLLAKLPPGATLVLTGEIALPVLARLEQRGLLWRDGRLLRDEPAVTYHLRLLPTALETAPGAVSRYERAMVDGSIVADLGTLLQTVRSDELWLVLSSDLRVARSAAAERLANELRAQLAAAGFAIVQSDADLGVVQLRRRR